MANKDRLNPTQIYKRLPRTNCKACGCMTCFAFAFDLLTRKKKPSDCPSLLEEEYRPTLEWIQESLGGAPIEGTEFILDENKCTGCGICGAVCEKASTTIVSAATGSTIKRAEVPPVFQIADGKLTVQNWSSCKRASEDNICKVCVEKCPFGAIDLVK